jgi:hypothetical protein
VLNLLSVVKLSFFLLLCLILLAQAQERYNTLVLEDTVLDGPYYFIPQGNSSDAFAKADVLAESFGFTFTRPESALRFERGDKVITLETTNDIVQGLIRQSDALHVNGVPVESPSAIVVGEDIYVAITPLVRAFGGDSQWFAAEQRVTLLREVQQPVETSNAAPFATPNTNLFVSVHVNSAQNSSASGVETWVFGEPLEPSLIALAVEENGGGAAGEARTREALEVATSIEGDIFKETQLAYSEALATTVQRALIDVTQSADRGVKQNAWYVIRHARSPAILVEIGFATNPDEGTRLTYPEYQAMLAQALAKGITTFLEGGGSVVSN